VLDEDKPASRRAPLLTSHANFANLYPETWNYRLKRILLGKPLVSEQLSGERLNRVVALGVLAPDCISSSAYGTEEILTQMTPFIGIAAFALVVPIMFVIIGVLFFVTISYLDVIKYYTTAGGSYVVARDNFGPKIAQIAAVALLIDYTVTVAVQVSAGTAALVTVVPQIGSLDLEITIFVVLVLIFGNLRGLREAGSYFAFPTYFYILMLSATIILGYYKEFAGTLHRLPTPPAHLLVNGILGHKGSGLLMGLAFISLLRAYANGGSSLTGLEAISNGVASFRRPESRRGPTPSPTQRVTRRCSAKRCSTSSARRVSATSSTTRCSAPRSSSSTPAATPRSTASPSSRTMWRPTSTCRAS
jgi:Amino acid permease